MPATPSHDARPIASEVSTTLQRTVLPDPIPADAETVFPHELSRYKQNGYGSWQYGSGPDAVKRLDLMPAAHDAVWATDAARRDKTIPWYQVRGDHDHSWMGFLALNDYLRQTYVGEDVLNIGNAVTALKSPDADRPELGFWGSSRIRSVLCPRVRTTQNLRSR